ncbi:MAG: archaemetzincin [Candidatus Omnitrophica bacterium]|nr:archaemetzincin [Candidatus Omnitrophota bacterium]
MKYRAIILIVSLLIAGPAQAKVINEHLYLVPVGDTDRKIIDAIKTKIPDLLTIAVKIHTVPAKPLPENAYDPARKQYNAVTITDTIAPGLELYMPDERILIIVDRDIYAPGFDFVFGTSGSPAQEQSGAGKRTSVISLARLRNEWYGNKPDERLFRERVVKQVINALGRNLGLPDCPDHDCVMYFSGDVAAIDKKKERLCIDCRHKLFNKYNKPLVDVSLKKILSGMK